MEGDAKMYRWTRSYPDRSTFRRSVQGDVVYESVEEQTEALEFNGHQHRAHCLFEIAYMNGTPHTFFPSP
jgi:hypothetical protein